ncbi:MAG: hypothetical protein JW860_12070 [Sedimentisphaerales bacterium]|nr:hypothetical protein [Sedimentisphaerales bacterium]
MKERTGYEIIKSSRKIGDISTFFIDIFYAVHYAIFHDSRHIFIFLLGDIAHLVVLRELLSTYNDQLLRLLENPNVLEHESFTELLRAVFHLTEELAARDTIEDSTPEDYEHLSKDIQRVYLRLVQQWVDYLKYLKTNYPYLFSLAVRKNPFDLNASVVIRSNCI